jgi:hypothetical protein
MLTSLRKLSLRLCLQGVAAGATDRVVGPTGDKNPKRASLQYREARGQNLVDEPNATS